MRNIKLKHLFVLFIGTLFCLLTACEQQEATDSLKGREVFLTITAGKQGLLPRATHTRASINEDADLYEDRVNSLYFMAVDANSGTKVADHYLAGILLEEEITFTEKIPVGTYDFYFVANMPITPTTAPANKAAMDDYLAALRDLSTQLFTGIPANQPPFFPMARVYRNQQIALPLNSGPGSSAQNPIYYHPLNENNETEEQVLLNRAVAKIEVTLTGVEANDVTMQLVNGVNEYTLSPLVADNKTKNTEHNNFHRIGTSNTYLFYTPEVIQSSSLNWDKSNPGDAINYLLIKLSGNEAEYKVPIVSNYTKESIVKDYIAFAEGKENGKTPEFNVLRNNHYKFDITINTEVDIDLYVDIKPWEKEVKINNDTYPGIVNLDRRTVALDSEFKGYLYFNFISEDIDASDYMQFVGVSTDKDGENLLQESYSVVKVDTGVYRLEFDFSETSPTTQAVYLHFKNSKSIREKSEIAIRIDITHP